MSNQAFQTLTRALHGAEPPEEMARLTEGQLEELAAAIETMHEHQEQALQQAMEDALSHVPAMLRKPVRRMLFH